VKPKEQSYSALDRFPAPIVPPSHRNLSLGLLGGFELRCNDSTLVLPMRVKRLLVFLALHHRPLARAYVSQTLWTDATDRHANGNLRSALWRLCQLDPHIIEVKSGQLALGRKVAVDYRRSTAFADTLLRAPESLRESELDERMLMEDLLPDWYEDWIFPEQEHYRQLRLHALEGLCDRFVSLQRFGRAVQVGVVAVAGEPLRESANSMLIRAHLAEGNVVEAIRHYRSYSRLLGLELGICPSLQMTRLIDESNEQAKLVDRVLQEPPVLP
jgi:DNA-binding SARP family transcriptional activator